MFRHQVIKLALFVLQSGLVFLDRSVKSLGKFFIHLLLIAPRRFQSCHLLAVLAVSCNKNLLIDYLTISKTHPGSVTRIFLIPQEIKIKKTFSSPRRSPMYY